MKGEIRMKIAEKIINKVGSAIPKIALSIGQNTSEQICIWWFHQPKIPAKLANFKKTTKRDN